MVWKRTMNNKFAIAYYNPEKKGGHISVIKLKRGWQTASTTKVKRFDTKKQALEFASKLRRI